MIYQPSPPPRRSRKKPPPEPLLDSPVGAVDAAIVRLPDRLHDRSLRFPQTATGLLFLITGQKTIRLAMISTIMTR